MRQEDRTAPPGGAVERAVREDPYDAFAWFYDRHWAGIFAEKALAAVEALVLPHIPLGSRVLDVCCGCGHLAAELEDRGYTLTGLDASEAMLEYARARAPEVAWVRADVRRFCLRPTQDAAVCLFDSLNHLLTVGDLARALGCVRESLRPGGLFLFDLNTERGFEERWVSEYEAVAEGGICRLSGGYDPVSRLGRYRFSLEGTGREAWRRAEFELLERCHSEDEVGPALAAAGFEPVEEAIAANELDMPDETGRVFFVARVPE